MELKRQLFTSLTLATLLASSNIVLATDRQVIQDNVRNKNINLIPFKLALGQFLGKGPRTAILFASISQEWPPAPWLASIVLFGNIWSLPSTVHIALSTTVFQVPTRMAS